MNDWTPPEDPPVRDDGRCARHGCTKALPRTRQAMTYAGWRLEADPFCSTTCARVHHGLGEPPSQRDRQRAKAGQVNADRYRSLYPMKRAS